ncbi:MAG: ABC transporter ATP-binding protein, partial [Actinomycetota bacterium]|nr:ABC transporter ATP-binding protein [Actinomycetota bacterium]
PSTIALADVVLYLAGGRLEAYGTHAELLGSSPGYADLVEAYERERTATPSDDGSTRASVPEPPRIARETQVDEPL